MANVITMPKLGFDMAEGTLIGWVKKEGESIEKGELLAEIETDKATVEVESLYTGTVRKLLVSAGAIVPINMAIAVIGTPDEEIDFDSLLGDSAPTDEAPAAAEAPATDEEPPAAADTPSAISAAGTPADRQLPDGVRASPLARRIAEENQVDVRQITGSGPQGRIVKQDVLDFIANGSVATATPAAIATAIPVSAEDQRVPLTRLRQAISRRMTDSKQNYPHFYVTHEFDLDKLMETRKQANATLADGGEKLSVNDFIIKATALALRQYPNLNASLGENEVIRHGHINIGVAVAVEKGLLTVVSHDADHKTLRQISQEIKDKAGRARSGKVRPDDIDGSTFSISNLGMFDVEHFIAIINPPEAAILAVGSANQVPVAKDGQLAVGWRMKATVSVDHRVSDGAEAAQFMQALADYLENPLVMML